MCGCMTRTSRSGQPVDRGSFEKRLSLALFETIAATREQPPGTTAFTIIYDKLRVHAYIHSALLTVPARTGRLQRRAALTTGASPRFV